jgi:hypothetical protein
MWLFHMRRVPIKSLITGLNLIRIKLSTLKIVWQQRGEFIVVIHVWFVLNEKPLSP